MKLSTLSLLSTICEVLFIKVVNEQLITLLLTFIHFPILAISILSVYLIYTTTFFVARMVYLLLPRFSSADPAWSTPHSSIDTMSSCIPQSEKVSKRTHTPLLKDIELMDFGYVILRRISKLYTESNFSFSSWRKSYGPGKLADITHQSEISL